jgi:hypothetical protein
MVVAGGGLARGGDRRVLTAAGGGHMADNDHQGPKRIGEILPPVKPLSRVHKRLLTIPLFEEDEDASIVYQHSVFCQTCMPYRNPGEPGG